MSIEVIAKILKELGGRAALTPEAGAFHARVMEDVAGQLDEVCEDLDEAPFDLVIRMESDPDPAKISLTIRAVSADFDHEIRLYAYQLNSKERSVLLRELLSEKRKLEARHMGSKPRVIVRKKSDNSYDLHAAAQKLGVGSEWFKKTVPCTGYNSEEGEDGNTILHFRYHKEMIDRLCKIGDVSFDADDLKYIADLCCEGDVEWARELIDALKSKSRRAPLPE